MQSMDLFGEALYDYHNGNQKTPFYLVEKNGEKFEQDLSWYFRDKKGYDLIEETLFDNVEGNELLDVGCATAYYFPILENKVKTIEGIDISEFAIKIALEKGYSNVRICDILDGTIKKQYDIITLMGNNLSIGGDINGTIKLIRILKGLLKKEGKILSIFKKIEDKKYSIGELKCEYNGEISDSFKWIRIKLEYLKELLKDQGLKLTVLSENDYGYCLEIKHIENEKIRTGVYAFLKYKNKLIVIKKGRGPFTGLYDLPGGKIEYGEKVIDSLKRELFEEIGIKERDYIINNLLTIEEDFVNHIWKGEKKEEHIIAIVYEVTITKENIDFKYTEKGGDSNGLKLIEYNDSKNLKTNILMKVLKKISIV